METKKLAKILVSIGAVLIGIGKIILEVSEEDIKKPKKKKNKK